MRVEWKHHRLVPTVWRSCAERELLRRAYCEPSTTCDYCPIPITFQIKIALYCIHQTINQNGKSNLKTIKSQNTSRYSPRTTVSSLSLLAVRGYVTWTILALRAFSSASQRRCWCSKRAAGSPFFSMESLDMSLRGPKSRSEGGECDL